MRDLTALCNSDLLELYRVFIVADCCDFGDQATKNYLAPWIEQGICLLAVEDEIFDRM